MKSCADDHEMHDVESLLEHLMSADVSQPSQYVDVTLPSSGLVRSLLTVAVLDMSTV